ncbi:MAG: WYL domain-containing protein [Actinomycetaceae bacterium]|nr:WYL domain-containing protein [Actinomycetaceae bacterium]
MSEKIQGDLRLLTLLLTLRTAPRGLSKTQIYQLIPAYQQLNEAARERMFERDKATLNELGMTLVVSAQKVGEPLYVLQLPAAPLRLDVAQRHALDLAARLWYDADDWGSDHQLFRYKVDAFSFDDASAVKAIVSGGKTASSLLEAITRGQVVQFSYRKLAEETAELRQVQPVALVFKDHALYLEGIDLGKGAARTFRLSRFVPDSLQVLGQTDPAQFPAQPATQRIREIEPWLFVADDFQMQASFWAAPSSFAKLVEAFSNEVFVPRPGWSVFRGYPATFKVWLERILAFPDQLLVADPGALQTTVQSLLAAAAEGQETDGN